MSKVKVQLISGGWTEVKGAELARMNPSGALEVLGPVMVEDLGTYPVGMGSGRPWIHKYRKTVKVFGPGAWITFENSKSHRGS